MAASRPMMSAVGTRTSPGEPGIELPMAHSPASHRQFSEVKARYFDRRRALLLALEDPERNFREDFLASP